MQCLFFDLYGTLPVVSVVQLGKSRLTLSTLWTAACQASLSFTISQFAQIHVH